MKKTFLFALIAVLTTAALLTGCTFFAPQTDSPTWVTTQFLNAVKANDAATMAKYYDGEIDPDEFDLESMIGDEADVTPEMRAVLKKLSKKVRDFDFKVTNEKIDGNKAHVDVEIKTYKFGSLVTDVIGDFVGSALSLALSGDDFDEAQFEKELAQMLDEKIDKLKDKSFTTTVPIYLTKTSDGWKVQELDDNFVNAILGGLMSTLSDIFGNLGSLLGGGSNSSSSPFDIFGSGDGFNPFDLFGSDDSSSGLFGGLSELLDT